MGGGYQKQEGGEEKEELGRMEELMKMSMAKELFETMRAYNQHKVAYVTPCQYNILLTMNSQQTVRC